MIPAVHLHCPYCGEPIELLVDPSAGDQRYIEDCQVCCRPMVVAVVVDDDASVSATVRAEDET